MKLASIGLVGTLGLLLLGCSSDADSVRSAAQYLTIEQSRVLGFEAPTTDWSSNNGSQISVSGEVSEGTSALSIAPNGYTEIFSTTIDAPGAARAAATFDLKLPQALQWGDARLVVRVPSKGHGWRDLGGTNLAGLSAGTFHELSFNVPQDVRDALASDATDVSFVIVLNSPQGVGEFVVDNLVVSDAAGSGEEEVSAEKQQFSLTIPADTALNSVLMAGSDRLIVDDRSTIGTAGELVNISGLGPSRTEFGAQVQTYANVTSVGDVDFFRSDSHVYGGVTTAGSILEQNGVQIDGLRAEGASVVPSTATWDVDWPVGVVDDISLPPDSPNVDIEPGAYDSIQVFSRARLTFGAGTYFVNSLVIEPQAKLKIDTSNGPVLIYARDTLRLSVTPEYVAGGEGQLLFGYLGNQAALFEEATHGTVVAPNSTIELRRPNSGNPHRGSFFGKEVHVFSDATIEHAPFNFDAICSANDLDQGGVLGCFQCQSKEVEVTSLGGALADLFAGRETLPSGKRVENVPEIPVTFSVPVVPNQVKAYLLGEVSTKYGGDCARDYGGVRKLRSVKLHAVDSEISSTVTFVPDEPLNLGCFYSLRVVDKPLNYQNACLEEPFQFDDVLVEFQLSSSVATRELSRTIPRPQEGTLAALEAAEGINTPAADALQRYIGEMGLDSEVDSFEPPAELVESTLKPGFDEGFYQLLHDGVPVHGAGMTVWSEDGMFRLAHGDVMRTTIDVQPSLDESAALAELIAAAGMTAPFPWDQHPGVHQPPVGRLYIAPTHKRPRAENDYRLAWYFDFQGSGATAVSVGSVDARTGEVVAFSPARRGCALVGNQVLDESALRATPTGPLNYSSGTEVNLTVDSLYDGQEALRAHQFNQGGTDFTVFARDFGGWSIEVGVTPTGQDPDGAITTGELECDYQSDGLVSLAEKDFAYDVAASVYANAHFLAEQLERTPFEWNGGEWLGLNNTLNHAGKMWVGPHALPDFGPTAYFDPVPPMSTPTWYFPTNLGGGISDATQSVVAHEMSHAMDAGIRAQAGVSGGPLLYEKEGGALVEGFAQVMQTWLRREAFQDPFTFVVDGSGAEIDLRDPESQGFPGYYELSPNWTAPAATCDGTNDYCAVHDNANVMTHWFNVAVEGRADQPNISGCYANIEALDPDPRVSIDMGGRILFAAWALLANNTDGYQALREKTTFVADQLYDSRAARIIAEAWSYVSVYGDVDPLMNSGNSPNSGANNIDPWDTELAWTVPDDGSEWSYQVATDSQFTDVVESGDATSYDVAGAAREAKVEVHLDASTEYFWRYKEKTAGSWDTCSSVSSSFTTSDRLLNMDIPSVATTKNPDDALVVVGTAYGILKTAGSSTDRHLEWGVGECTNPSESIEHDGEGKASIGNVFQPEYDDYEDFPQLRTGGVSEDAVLVYVREIADNGGKGTCGYFKVRTPDVPAFNPVSQGFSQDEFTWEPFGDLQVEWESAGAGVEYEVSFFQGTTVSDHPVHTFPTTDTTPSLPDELDIAQTSPGLWGWQVRAFSASGLGYRWAVGHSQLDVEATPQPKRQWYKSRAGEVRPEVPGALEVDYENYTVYARRPWDGSGEGPGTVDVTIDLAKANAEFSPFWPHDIDRTSTSLVVLAADSPFTYTFTHGTNSSGEDYFYGFTTHGFAEANYVDGSNPFDTATPESDGPSVNWQIEWVEDEPVCFDSDSRVQLPPAIYQSNNSLPCVIYDGVIDQNTTEAGDMISMGCITPMLGGTAAVSWEPVDNASRYEYILGHSQIFGDETSHVSDVVSVTEPRVQANEVDFVDVAREYVDSDGEVREACITSVLVRAFDHEDCGENAIESEVAWIYFFAGTPHCQVRQGDSPDSSDELADFCAENPFASQCTSSDEYCVKYPSASECVSDEDFCTMNPFASGC